MSMSLSNWDHFGTRTIFINGNAPKEVDMYIDDIAKKLRAIGIPTSPDEKGPHIHMSIARFLRPSEYQNVWKYLQSVPAPKFDLKFDNLTIFYKENKDDKVWKVLKTFPLTGVKK